MRKDFLRDLVTHLQDERVGVFFSSHLLYEVEPVADSVVILDKGRVLRAAATDDLRATVKRIVAAADAESILARLPGLLDIARSGRQATAVTEDVAAARAALSTAGVAFEEVDLNLDEIFEAFVIGRKEATGATTATTVVERVA
jgi:ABC-2 type transport system ATP-binding protein